MIGRPSFGAPKVRSRIFPCVSYCSGDISAVAVTALYSSRSGVCIVTGPSLPSFFVYPYRAHPSPLPFPLVIPADFDCPAVATHPITQRWGFCPTGLYMVNRLRRFVAVPCFPSHSISSLAQNSV